MKRLVTLTDAYDVAGQTPQTTSYTYGRFHLLVLL
jgi:hypothetical protein